MTDGSIEVTCPKCGYKSTWRPASDFPSALDMYTKCPEITEILNNHPELREKVGGNPRLCRAFKNEWVRLKKAKDRELPPKGK
jgi:hypothetical protein